MLRMVKATLSTRQYSVCDSDAWYFGLLGEMTDGVMSWSSFLYSVLLTAIKL